MRDKDYKYGQAFDKVFENAGVAVEPTAPRSPNQNVFVERWITSLRYECLNRFIVFGLEHLDYMVRESVSFYNERRPHQKKDNKPLLVCGRMTTIH